MEIDYEQRKKDLKELQAENLEGKIQNTMAKVIEWCNRNLSKTLKDGTVSLFYKGIDLRDYKEQIDKAFEKLEKIEKTRKKWLKE